MKLIITIPKDKYRYIQELEQGNTDYATTQMLYHAVKHGKPYLEQEPKTDTWSIKEVADALEKHGLLKQEPKTGHWIYTGDYITDGMLKCSECDFEHDVSERFFYCPHCGAKMED